MIGQTQFQFILECLKPVFAIPSFPRLDHMMKSQQTRQLNIFMLSLEVDHFRPRPPIRMYWSKSLCHLIAMINCIWTSGIHPHISQGRLHSKILKQITQDSHRSLIKFAHQFRWFTHTRVPQKLVDQGLCLKFEVSTFAEWNLPKQLWKLTSQNF